MTPLVTRRLGGHRNIFDPGRADWQPQAPGTPQTAGRWQCVHGPDDNGVRRTVFGLSPGLPGRSDFGAPGYPSGYAVARYGVIPNGPGVGTVGFYGYIGTATPVYSGPGATPTSPFPPGTVDVGPLGLPRLHDVRVLGAFDPGINDASLKDHSALIDGTFQTIGLQGVDSGTCDGSGDFDPSAGYVYVNGKACELAAYTASPRTMTIRTAPGVAPFTLRKGAVFSQERYQVEFSNVVICNPLPEAANLIRRTVHLAPLWLNGVGQVIPPNTVDNLNTLIPVGTTGDIAVTTKNPPTVSGDAWLGGIDRVQIVAPTGTGYTVRFGQPGYAARASYNYRATGGGCAIVQATSHRVTVQEDISGWDPSGVIDFAGIFEACYAGIDVPNKTFTGVSFISSAGASAGAFASAGDPVRTLAANAALSSLGALPVGLNAVMLGIYGSDVWVQYGDEVGASTGLTLGAPNMRLKNVYDENALSDGYRVSGDCAGASMPNIATKIHPGTNTARTANHVDGLQALSGFGGGAGKPTIDWGFWFGPAANANLFHSRNQGNPASFFGSGGLVFSHMLVAMVAKAAQIASGCDGGLQKSWIARNCASAIANGWGTTLAVTAHPNDTGIQLAGSMGQFNPAQPFPGPNGLAADFALLDSASAVVSLTAGANAQFKATPGVFGLQDGAAWAVCMYNQITGANLLEVWVLTSSDGAGNALPVDGSFTFHAATTTVFAPGSKAIQPTFASIADPLRDEPTLIFYGGFSAGLLSGAVVGGVTQPLVGLVNSVSPGVGVSGGPGVMVRLVDSGNVYDDGTPTS